MYLYIIYFLCSGFILGYLKHSSFSIKEDVFFITISFSWPLWSPIIFLWWTVGAMWDSVIYCVYFEKNILCCFSIFIKRLKKEHFFSNDIHFFEDGSQMKFWRFSFPKK